jgi:hypothetical protein
MGYHFVRADLPHPIWDEMKAIPYGLLPFLFLVAFLLIPPKTQLPDLRSLQDSPGLYEGRNGQYAWEMVDGIRCIRVMLTDDEKKMEYYQKREDWTERLRGYYMDQRNSWNTDEWTQYLHTALCLNDLDDSTAEFLYIPMLPPDYKEALW